MKALVTGWAGFLGSHLVDRLLAEGWQVAVVDIVNHLYDPEIKRKNVKPHLRDRSFEPVEADIRQMETLS